MQIEWTSVSLRPWILHARNDLSMNAFGSRLLPPILCGLKLKIEIAQHGDSPCPVIRCCGAPPRRTVCGPVTPVWPSRPRRAGWEEARGCGGSGRSCWGWRRPHGARTAVSRWRPAPGGITGGAGSGASRPSCWSTGYRGWARWLGRWSGRGWTFRVSLLVARKLPFLKNTTYNIYPKKTN